MDVSEAPDVDAVIADAADAPGPRTMTLREVSEAVPGLTVAALRSRIDRGTLPYVKRRDGLRAIPVSVVRGLAASVGDAGSMQADAATSPMQPLDAMELVERLTMRCIDAERRASQIEAQKLLTERSEASAIEALHEARAKVAALEEQVAVLNARRRWWRR